MNEPTKQTNERDIGLDVLLLVGFLLLEVMLYIGCSQTQSKMDSTENISWHRQFDDKGQLTELADAAGRVTRFHYSQTASGKTIVTKTNMEEESVEFEYDERNLLATMKDALGHVSYQYDASGRLVQVQRTGEQAIQYQYDSKGRIVRQSIGDFYALQYRYDFTGRLSGLDTPAGTITYDYHLGQGMVIRILPNGVKTIWTFGVNRQLEQASHVDRHNFVLVEFRYQYRPDGLLDAIAEKTRNGEKITFFKYDTVGRLIQAFDQSGNRYQYEYDLLGNRVRATSPDGHSQTGEYDWAGRLVRFNGKECRYDAAGNLCTFHCNDSEMNFKYFQDQRLASANDRVFYTYAGDGKLEERRVDKEKTKFISNPLSDSWQPLVIKKHTGMKTLLIWDGNSPLLKITNGRVEYMLHDHIGSARLILDDHGEITQHMDYSPFGEPDYQMAGNGVAVGFSGLLYDSQAKLYLAKARAYCPVLGRFMQIEPEQRPPTGSQKNLSPYAYCGHDPANFIDPSGARPAFVWGPENLAWQYFRLMKDDISYFLFIPTRDDVISEIMNNAINNDQYPGDYEKAFNLIFDWRMNYNLYIAEHPDAKMPTPAEFQIAENTMFARYMPPAAMLAPYWSVAHYQAEKNGLKPVALGLQGDTWQRQTWKTVVYPMLGGVEGLIKRIGDFIERPAYGDEIAPSTVGGVALSGAGTALDGLNGHIEGLSIDANNNLILVSKKGEHKDLPSMRIDDVVTVFRSVYIHGEGPNVTIDPNPNDPEHSAMIIKHGTATENTYVGWVLYHADRLMKAYMLGVDNITKKDVISKIPGYRDVLNAIYFGEGAVDASNYKGKWERFWIVPDKVHQFSAEHNDLTLFDVPLKLETQVMKWEKGQLVDDPLGKSSLGARKFTEWFSHNYSAIAGEQYLMPPAEFGIKDSVQVFNELRQIAFITAIAEALRDRGVAMPFWMREHEVKQLSLEKYTPAMLISRSDGGVNARIFGGVSLSASSRDVKHFKTIGEVSRLSGQERIRGEQNLKLARTLATAVREYSAPTNPVQLTEFKVDNQSYQIVQLPGADTKVLSPCRIEEVDLTVAIPGGREIHLSRHFNSFFNPKDIWGQPWTMNLPQLEKIKVATDRTANQVTYHVAYELLTPLNSTYARFSEVEEVPVLHSRLQTPDVECAFFGLANSAPNYLSNNTLELIGKTGESWHFTESGDLIAIEKDGFRTVYLRSESGYVKQIIGLLGRTRMASIDLEYDLLNRLTTATGKNHLGETETVRYEYDASGNLSGMTSPQRKLAYAYQNHRVWQVSRQDSGDPQSSGKVIRQRFEYNDAGQLIAHYNGPERSIAYTLVPKPGRTTLQIKRSGEKPVSSFDYDAAFRPLDMHFTDGTQVRWEYPVSGGRSIEMVNPEGKKIHITESSDGSQRIIEDEQRPTVMEKYDSMGRLTQVDFDHQRLFYQHWSASGKLEAIETEDTVIRPEYDSDGLTKRIAFFPPGSGDQPRTWETHDVDLAGRPVAIKDFSGLDISIQYDPNGAVTHVIHKRNGENFGYEFSRNENGRIESMQSSWGTAQLSYDTNGVLSKMIINKAGIKSKAQAMVAFQAGLVHKVSQFDGGDLEIAYYSHGPCSGMLKQVKSPLGLTLDYRYNSSGDLDEVNIGGQRLVRLQYDDNRRIVGYSVCNN